MKSILYRDLQETIKKQLQTGEYQAGDYIPSENELCATFEVTRTTVRKALDELQKEGFIVRHRGKGSMVLERKDALGLLTVRGFSDVVGKSEKTDFLLKPHITKEHPICPFDLSIKEKTGQWIYFLRLRHVNEIPVMIENSWLLLENVKDFLSLPLVNGSLFKTLSQRYFIEIVGSDQELRARVADESIATVLKVEKNAPVLEVMVKYFTSIPEYYIYSQLLCDTEKYPISNKFFTTC